MKQLQYISAGRLEWRDMAEPRLQSDRDVIVHPLAVTRCDLDIFIASGKAGMPGPFAMGHETYGEVCEVGDAIRNFQPGDGVLVPFQISCGECGRCRAGFTALCEGVPYRSSYGMAPLSGIDYGGGLSDRLRVPFADHMLIHAPPNLAPEALAGVTDNVTTALTLVLEPLRQHPRAPVLIVGGRGKGVALHVIQCALAMGSDKVVYVDSDSTSLALARRLGAEIVNESIGPATPAIGAFRYTIDCSGTEDGLAFAIRCTAFEGLCQRSYGDFVERTPVPLRDMYGRHITLKLGRVHARAHMCETLQLMQEGLLHPEHVITRRAAFSEAAEAMLEPSNKVVFLADATH